MYMYMHVNVHVQQTLKLDEDLTCGTKVEIFNSHLCDDTDEYISILVYYGMENWFYLISIISMRGQTLQLVISRGE